MFDPELFMRPDGLPMAFMMTCKGRQTERVKQLVEERGGVVLDQPGLVYRDNMVRLLVGGEASLQRHQEMFDYRYVLDCVKEDTILPNLLDYRGNSHLPSILQQYDPADVLLGYKRWKDIPEVDGEKVSDIEEDDNENGQSSNAKRKVFKSFRMPYSKDDQIEMVDFLVSHSAYKVVKGNSIWESMEEGGLCKGARTWQSMKEHFRKKIVPEIHRFGLSWKQVRRFRAAFGLDQEQESNEEEAQEERIEGKRDEPRPHSAKRVDQFMPRRTSFLIDDTNKMYETLSDKNDDNESGDVIASDEEEGDVSEEVIAMKRKRNLSSRDVFLNHDTPEEFSVPPVKKGRFICDIVEGDKVDLDKAVNIGYVHGVEASTVNDKTHTASQLSAFSSTHLQTEKESENAEAIEDIACCVKTLHSSYPEGNDNLKDCESLEDIFDDEYDTITAENSMLPSPSNHRLSGADNLTYSSTISNPPLQDRSVSPSNNSSTYPLDITAKSTCQQKYLSESASTPQDMFRSPSHLWEVPGSTTPHKNNVSRSTTPMKDRPSLSIDISRSISRMKDMSESTSRLRYTRSVKVQLRKSSSTSPLKNVSSSTSPLKDLSVPAFFLNNISTSSSTLENMLGSISPLKDMSRSKSPLKDMSRFNSPLRDMSRSNSPMKDMSRFNFLPLKIMSRSSSPLKYTKSVRVQLRKLVLHPPFSCCQNTTGRVVRDGPLAARENGGGKNEDDTDSNCTDADQVDSLDFVITEHDELTRPKIDKTAKKNAGNNFTETKSAKAEREVWYASRFKQPYSRGEEEAVVNYLLRNGGYSLRRGNAVWRKMEEDWICPGRTWQSLKERFGKSIEKNLKQFGVSKAQLEEVDSKMEVSSMEGREGRRARGFRQNANYYSREEDLNILKFISESERFDDVRGKEVWQVLEERKVVKGRSWQSMKERFRKVISERIRTYGLSKEIVRRFEGFEAMKQEKRRT